MNDAKFIENIFNIELPRATKLNEMAPKSAYFFKGPNYDDAEVGAFFAKLKATTYGTCRSVSARSPALAPKGRVRGGAEQWKAL